MARYASTPFFRREEECPPANESCGPFKLWVTFVSPARSYTRRLDEVGFVRAVTAALSATDAYRVTLRILCRGRFLCAADRGSSGRASDVNLEGHTFEGLALPKPRTLVGRVWHG